MNENDRLELVAGHRRCVKCHIAKPLNQFHKQARGKLHPRCKVCRNEGFIAQRAAMAAANPAQAEREARRQDAKYLATQGKRRCRVCGEAHVVANFVSQGHTCMSCEGKNVAEINRRRDLRQEALAGQRTCKGCEKLLGVEDFYARSGGDGYQSYCKACYNKPGGPNADG